MGRAGEADQLLKVAGDELGPLSEITHGRAWGNLSLARPRIGSISASVMEVRMSQ